MVITLVSPSSPPGSGIATTGPISARPPDAEPLLLGRAAVTPAPTITSSRADAWPDPPSLPAPLKGLGIPPLNTRQVGDFDKLDEPLPPPVGYAPPEMAAPGPEVSAGLDVRR